MKRPIDMLSIPKTTAASIIKSFRENFEISQEDMSWACGISQANLSAIENGRREVGPKLAVKIAAFLDINPVILLYPNGYDSLSDFKEVQKRREKLA